MEMFIARAFEEQIKLYTSYYFEMLKDHFYNESMKKEKRCDK